MFLQPQQDKSVLNFRSTDDSRRLYPAIGGIAIQEPDNSVFMGE